MAGPQLQDTSPLEAVDRVASSPDTPVDTASARDQLRLPGIAQGTPDGYGRQEPALPAKRRGGWQKGRRRKPEGAQPKRTKAELEEALAAAEGRLEELEQGPDEPETFDQEIASLAGTLEMLSGLIAETPYRALAVDKAQSAKLAELWAPLMAPYMEQAAASMPVAVALLGTAQIMYPKYVQFRQDVAGVEITPAEPEPDPSVIRNADFPRPRGAEVSDD